MKNSIGIALALSITQLLTGCGDSAEKRMKQKMESLLIDPASAEYRDVTVYTSGYVCGLVNAKNRMGGYTGSQRFMYFDDTQSLVIDPDRREFDIRCRDESKAEYFGVGSAVIGSPRWTAEAELQAIETALKIYRLDNYVYPSTEQGLQALITASAIKPQPRNFKAGGYIEASDLIDPWGREYLFISPGENSEVDLFSYGADGLPGGDGENADIGNWMLTP